MRMDAGLIRAALYSDSRGIRIFGYFGTGCKTGGCSERNVGNQTMDGLLPPQGQRFTSQVPLRAPR